MIVLIKHEEAGIFLVSKSQHAKVKKSVGLKLAGEEVLGLGEDDMSQSIS